MKKQYLFGALAFSAMFASCNNELDTVAESVKPETEMKEVVGADLVSNGLSINLGSAESRALNGEWLTTDKLALAWYNVSLSGISATQDSRSWNNILKGLSAADPKIYANHKFTPNADGEFVTESNVYQGAHFVYFPYKRESQVQQKVVKVNELAYTAKPENDPNPNAYAYDYYNKAFYLSAQDFIAADDVDAEGKLTSQFVMSPMVNAINVHAESLVEGEALKALEITDVTIKSKQSIFADQFNVNPGEIPAVVRDREGVILTDKTIEALDAYAKSVAASNYKTSITRNVEAGLKLTAETNNVVLYTLPTAAAYGATTGTVLPATDKDLTVTVNAKSEHGVKATFTIQVKDDETDNNNEFLPKLVGHLKGSLKEIRRTENGSWNPLNTLVELTNDNVKVTYNIANKDQWDDAVALANDLGEDVTFTLVDEVEFTETINLPAEDIKLTVVSKDAKGVMLINGNVEWPYNEDLNVVGANVEVEEEATLSINGVDAENRNALVANVTNYGTILLNEFATLEGVDNNERIIVAYGSYVKIADSKDKGVIAFNVLTDTEAYKINNLISDNDKFLGHAFVNMLIINENNVLDLVKKDGTSQEFDPYTGKIVNGGTDLADLKGIDIEMNGGTIEGEQEHTKAVKSITVVSGSNLINDVNIMSNLVVKNGAEATVDATEHLHGQTSVKHDVIINGDIDNEGTIIANVTVNTANIDNEKGALVVNDGYTIWYSDEFIQGKSVNGYVNKAVNGVGITTVTLPEGGTNVQNAQAFADAAASVADGSVVYLPTGIYEGAQMNFGNTYTGNVVNIVGEGKAEYITSTHRGLMIALNNNVDDLLLKNIEVKSTYTGLYSGTKFDIAVKSTNCSPNSTKTIVVENVKCDILWFENAGVDGVTFNVELVNCDINEVGVHAFKKDKTRNYTTHINVTVDGGNVNVVKGGNAPENVTITEK